MPNNLYNPTFLALVCTADLLFYFILPFAEPDRQSEAHREDGFAAVPAADRRRGATQVRERSLEAGAGAKVRFLVYI